MIGRYLRPPLVIGADGWPFNRHDREISPRDVTPLTFLPPRRRRLSRTMLAAIACSVVSAVLLFLALEVL